MRVAKWGNSLAVGLPAKVVKELDLAQGDEVVLRAAGPGTLEVTKDDERAWAIQTMRRILARSGLLPPAGHSIATRPTSGAGPTR